MKKIPRRCRQRNTSIRPRGPGIEDLIHGQLGGDFERLAGANREVDALFVIPAETLVHFGYQRPHLISVALDVANTIRILVDRGQWLGIGDPDAVTKNV